MTTPQRRPLRIALATFAMAALAAGSLASATAVIAADAPDGCSAATTGSKNTWLSGTIATVKDVDWYRFRIKTGKRVLLTLGGLPADYDLSLYGGCSTLIASSQRSDREFGAVASRGLQAADAVR